MGKIVKDKYPGTGRIRSRGCDSNAVAALNLTQKAKEIANGGGDGEESASNTAFVDGVSRGKFAMDVRDLDIDLIDRINPFLGEALFDSRKDHERGKLSNRSLRRLLQKRSNLTPGGSERPRPGSRLQVSSRRERGRLPSITSADAWEKKVAEGTLRCLHAFQERRSLCVISTSRNSARNLRNSRRRRKRQAGRTARSASSRVSKRSSASSRSMKLLAAARGGSRHL